MFVGLLFLFGEVVFVLSGVFETFADVEMALAAAAICAYDCFL